MPTYAGAEPERLCRPPRPRFRLLTLLAALLLLCAAVAGSIEHSRFRLRCATCGVERTVKSARFRTLVSSVQEGPDTETALANRLRTRYGVRCREHRLVSASANRLFDEFAQEWESGRLPGASVALDRLRSVDARGTRCLLAGILQGEGIPYGESWSMTTILYLLARETSSNLRASDELSEASRFFMRLDLHLHYGGRRSWPAVREGIAAELHMDADGRPLPSGAAPTEGR